VRPAEANRPDVKQDGLSETQVPPAPDATETRRGVGAHIEDVRRQKSVQRIARHDTGQAARRIRAGALAEEISASRADARRGGSEGENGVCSPCEALPDRAPARLGDSE